MSTDKNSPAMSQKIFDLGLDVETISVYLLCCGLADTGTPIRSRKLLDVWNGTPAALTQGLAELERFNIVKKIIADRDDTAIYQLTPDDGWKRA